MEIVRGAQTFSCDCTGELNVQFMWPLYIRGLWHAPFQTLSGVWHLDTDFGNCHPEIHYPINFKLRKFNLNHVRLRPVLQNRFNKPGCHSVVWLHGHINLISQPRFSQIDNKCLHIKGEGFVTIHKHGQVYWKQSGIFHKEEQPMMLDKQNS